MRGIYLLITLLFLIAPPAASGQSFMVHGSGGPTVVDSGHSLAGGVGFSPTSRMTVLVELERTHLSSRVRSDGRGGVTGFRGGTLMMGSAELRVSLLGGHRAGPYGLAGFAVGVSRPNVNAMFPDRISNDVRAMFFGGGVQLPLGEQISIFADGRMLIGSEAGELLAVAPIRAGIGWRF